MSCTASELTAAMDQFRGGSVIRYFHQLNPKCIYTEGVQVLAQTTQAYWLLDLIALKLAPVYAKAWLEGSASIGIVKLDVSEAKCGSRSAVLTLGLEDGAAPAVTETLGYTDFPVGQWTLYLGTDEDATDQYVTTVMVPQEY